MGQAETSKQMTKSSAPWRGISHKNVNYLLHPFRGISKRPSPRPRRGAGAVERGGLENRCGCKPTQGSNPCLSAIFPLERRKISGLPLKRPMRCMSRGVAWAIRTDPLRTPCGSRGLRTFRKAFWKPLCFPNGWAKQGLLRYGRGFRISWP